MKLSICYSLVHLIPTVIEIGSIISPNLHLRTWRYRGFSILLRRQNQQVEELGFESRPPAPEHVLELLGEA